MDDCFVLCHASGKI